MRIAYLCLLLGVVPLVAQNGDRRGEVQVAPMKENEIPPSPVLSVEESLKTFKLPPGFKIEVVAAEPMVQAPVAMTFHPDGSLYVLEMRGFMPNVDGTGEDARVGRVSVLRDTNGDGRMDQSTVFLDGLQMPRAIGLAYGGLLVGEPPNLWFCKDTNGDFVSDEKTLIATNYGSQGNPEHNANGLMWAMDNWIYNAKHTNRLRHVEGKWIQDAMPQLGQWGISQDDFGRLVFNSNANYLRGDLAPAELLFRNANHANAYGVNVQWDRSQATFPARPNPGVNRAYQKGQLRADGTLASFTGACGPVIYRGDQFDSSYYGAAFVCEPTGNFVRCSKLTETNGVVSATNAFPGAEFLTSTEERFRPVNLHNGPDGALYIVDMHRGVVQHRIFLTTYLRNQALSRGLETPLEQGRIYRVVQEGRPLKTIESLKTNTLELVSRLESGNGWTRDNAQRLLVERGDASAVDRLSELAIANGQTPAAVHALWTLHGMGKLKSDVIVAALKSRNARARATAARLAGERAAAEPAIVEALAGAARDDDALVKLHVAFALSPVHGIVEARRALAAIVEAHASEPLFRDAAISGLGGREVEFLEALLKEPAWKEKREGFDKFVVSLSRAAAVSSQKEAVNRLLELALAEKSWRRGALIDGILATSPAAPRGRPAPTPRLLHLASEPSALAAIKKERDAAGKISALENILTWPGKAGGAQQAVKPLTEAEQALFNAGKETYTLTCAACHQPNGQGQEGLAPSLVDADWVTGSEKRLGLIVLHGLRGPITVNGKQHNLEMPPLGVLEDEQIAGILTYVRREWGHTASPVTTEFIKKLRDEHADRADAWTEEELAKLK